MEQPQFVTLVQEAVERALEDAASSERLVRRLRAERDALYAETLRLGGDPSAILRGLSLDAITSLGAETEERGGGDAGR